MTDGSQQSGEGQRRGGGGGNSKLSMATIQRLQQWDRARQRKLEHARKVASSEQDELAECTFKPTLVRRARTRRGTCSAPFHCGRVLTPPSG